MPKDLLNFTSFYLNITGPCSRRNSLILTWVLLHHHVASPVHIFADPHVLGLQVSDLLLVPLDDVLLLGILFIDIVLKLKVSLETIKRRIFERKNLEKRSDDSEYIAIKRFKDYENNIKPVIDFYKQSKLLKEVNGEASIIEISNEISGLIASIKG